MAGGSDERRRVLARLTGTVLAGRPPDRPARVAVDGVTAGGKTTLADELGRNLQARGQLVVRVRLDDFHRPRRQRYRRGRDSPEGYYLDAFDYAALRRHLLDPLGPGGSRRCRTAVFDLAADVPLDVPPAEVPPEAVVVVDGVFLQRPELAGAWDLVCFVQADEAEVVRRVRRRDAAHFGSADEAEAMLWRRYLPAQRRYVTAVDPAARADVVVDNTDAARPRLTRVPGD